MLYHNVLLTHSFLRWIIVLSVLIVIFCSVYGWIKKTKYTKFDNIMSIILVGSTHVQVLLGLWLYFFLSPMTTTRLPSNFMKDPVLRYWKVEHFLIMIVFLILVQLGRSISKKRTTPTRKHKVMAIFSILAFALLMFGMPWPNKPYGRPLLSSNRAIQCHNFNV